MANAENSSETSAPIYGNYHGYYSKRPSVRDPRLALLPPSLLEGARVLDVGCNEGWVTCEIAQLWGARKVVGVDIDETLIRAAWRRRRAVWSLQGPFPGGAADVSGSPPPAESSSSRNNLKRKRDTGAPTSDTLSTIEIPRAGYFPTSCEHEFGSLPVPPSDNRGKHTFPHNVTFRTVDWTQERILEDVQGYDVVIAFSVSKWIHLNGGDEALRSFFSKVHNVLEPGGLFILEPQAWDTYSKAKRMSEKLRENAKALKVRPEDFGKMLEEIGFGPAERFGVVGEGGFRRPVDLYRKL